MRKDSIHGFHKISNSMTGKLIDDLDLYSDLLSSIGTGDENRPLTPIECSDYIKRLQEETQESLEKISTRLGLGKKRKIKTMDEPPDTTQIKLFLNLQNLSRKSAYMLRFGKSTGDKVGFTIGCLVADLPVKRDQDVILQTVIKNADSSKPITKTDVMHILERKKKSSEMPIEEIIKHVMKIKPVTKVVNMIVFHLDYSTHRKLDLLMKKLRRSSKEVMTCLINKKFTNNEILSISLKGDNVYISINEEQFKAVENNWKSSKTNMSGYFNKILSEAINSG